MQTVRTNWSLLAICGLLNAALCAACSIMQAPGGSLTWRHAAVRGTAELLGQLALATGVCTLAASVWRSGRRVDWPLMGNGLALGSLGLVLLGVAGAAVSFRTIAGLVVVMALSLGVLVLTAASASRRNRLEMWVWGMASAGAVAYVAAFLWMKPVPGTHSEILWVGSYFGFQAACLLGLAWKKRTSHLRQEGRWTVGPTAVAGPA
jgi:uncharacterized membrane protein HdeD (DUF308 family)